MPDKTLKPEDVLLRYCARTDIASGGFDLRIKELLKTNLDWKYFLTKARNELLSPLVYKSLTKTNGGISLPSNVCHALEENYYSTLSRNVSLILELEKIAGAFQEEGIKFLLFKGLALAADAYRDLGLRSCGDLDILIKIEDIPKADAALRQLGYNNNFDIKKLSAVNFNNYRNSFFYLNHNKQKAPAHIYWHLINLVPYDKTTSSLDMDTIWDEAQPIKIGDISLLTFSRCHQIIYLSMHALNHGFYPLILLCDLNEILRREGGQLDWDKLISQSYNFGLSKFVYHALYLCSGILRADVPSDVINRLRPKAISLFEKKFISRIQTGKPVFKEGWLASFGMNETLPGRISFLRRALFPSKTDLAFIRQKDVSSINILDYIRRAGCGLNSAVRALLTYL